MKKYYYLLVITSLLSFNEKINGQSEKQIDSFIKKTDNYLIELSSNTSSIAISKGINNRKIKLKGNFENGAKSFIQKIKYYKGGVKKEKIIVKLLTPTKPLTLLKIILINNEYFYIKYITYSQEGGINKISDERLIDKKIYRKTEYGVNNHRTNKIEIWNTDFK